MDRLKSHRIMIAAYLRSAKVLADAIWGRLFTKLLTNTTTTRFTVGDKGGDSTPNP